MRVIKIEGNIITTETKKVKGMLFWKREVSVIRQFKGLDNLSNRYWAWVELPDINLVPDGLAFQLDSWMTNGIENG